MNEPNGTQGETYDGAQLAGQAAHSGVSNGAFVAHYVHDQADALALQRLLDDGGLDGGDL